MKLRKLKLNEASKAELNEREMCRVLGGGTPGCCQCGCNYEGKPGGSSTSANESANNAHGYTSDGSHPCCSEEGSGSGDHGQMFLLCTDGNLTHINCIN